MIESDRIDRLVSGSLEVSFAASQLILKVNML